MKYNIKIENAKYKYYIVKYEIDCNKMRYT